jgi:Arc/MetJ-type ribon-helix-helix transcriptional regulator
MIDEGGDTRHHFDGHAFEHKLDCDICEPSEVRELLDLLDLYKDMLTGALTVGTVYACKENGYRHFRYNHREVKYDLDQEGDRFLTLYSTMKKISDNTNTPVLTDHPDVHDTNMIDGRRLTVWLPPTLCDDLDTLVEDGLFQHESDIIRAALRQLTTAANGDCSPPEQDQTTEMEESDG